ncbi:hypothetical protein AS593_22055 [Caulobacter vibrioides]|nr:hypothetical protein AS593_22055 [Caulobacter vibrioides]
MEFDDLVANQGLHAFQPVLGPVDGPEDYAEFLRRFGFGTLEIGSLTIYSGLVDPPEIYGPAWSGPQVRIFGDDRSGGCFAFHPAGNAVVRLEADGEVGAVVASSFGAFLRKYL